MNNNIFIKNIEKSFLIITVIVLYGYIILRSIRLSFTHDESLSFLISMGNEHLGQTANNHLLNTKLMNISYHLFGSSEFALRLPNILAFGVYIFASYLIIKQINTNWIRVSAYIFLFFNPYLLEFFSLARGYGISVALFMVSVYFFLKTLKKDNQTTLFTNYIGMLLFSSLAIYSNLTIINWLIAMIILVVIHYFRIVRDHYEQPYGTVWFIAGLGLSFVPILLGVERLLFLDGRGQLYFGVSNLYQTVNSIFIGSNYLIPHIEWVVYSFLFFGIGIAFYAVSVVWERKNFTSAFTALNLLVLLVAVGLIAENILFNSFYPLGRTSLVFIPMFGLIFAFFLDELKNLKSIPSIYFITPLLVIIFLIGFNFYKSVNFQYAKDWGYDSGTKEAILKIDELTHYLDRKVNISITWKNEPAINFYIRTKNLNINPVEREGFQINSDFIYSIEDFDDVNFKKIFEHQISHGKLYVNTKNIDF